MHPHHSSAFTTLVEAMFMESVYLSPYKQRPWTATLKAVHTQAWKRGLPIEQWASSQCPHSPTQPLQQVNCQIGLRTFQVSEDDSAWDHRWQKGETHGALARGLYAVAAPLLVALVGDGVVGADGDDVPEGPLLLRQLLISTGSVHQATAGHRWRKAVLQKQHT